jgi:hypothetical protein
MIWPDMTAFISAWQANSNQTFLFIFLDARSFF